MCPGPWYSSNVRGFVVGLLVGAVAGGGATYLGMTKPWSSTAETGMDAGVPEVAAKGNKKRKRRRRGKRRKVERYKIEGDEVINLTAADRAMRSRGPGVRLPPKKLDMAGGGESRSLNGGEINGAIRRGSAGVLSCIKKARGGAPLAGTVTLKMLVDGNGAVRKVRVSAAKYLFDKGLYGCAKGAARAMRFPAVGGYTVVTAPYSFN